MFSILLSSFGNTFQGQWLVRGSASRFREWRCPPVLVVGEAEKKL
jgi:hypothetical protein